MKKGKRLLVMLLATLVMVAGAFSAAYAAYYDNHYVYRIHSSGSTSTVTCAENDTHITINISRDDATYDGSGKAASVSVSPSNGYRIKSQTSTQYNFEYDRTGDDPGAEDAGYIRLGTISYSGTTAAGNNYSSTTAPSDAGDYTASVEISAYRPNDSHQGTLTISKSFKITPKSIEVVWTDNSGTDPEDAWTYYYNGENHAPTAKITSGLVQDDDVDVTVSGAAKTVADHTATAKLVGRDSKNYVVSNETQAFTIAPKPVKVQWKGNGGSTTDFEYTYNGNEQGPTCEIVEGLVKGESCTVSVTGQETDAGEYEAEAKLSNTNYVIDETAPSASTHGFKIVEYEIVELTWDPDTFVYNADYQHPTAVVSKQGNKEPVDCELDYTVYKADAQGEPTGESIPEGTKMNVGKYVVKGSLKDGESNFVLAGSAVTSHPFTITPCPVTAELDIASEIVYDGEYHYPTPTLNTIYDADKESIKPVGVIIGKNMDGHDVSVILKNDDFSDEGIGELYPEIKLTAKGVTHASSGSYKAYLVDLYDEEAQQKSANYKLVKTITKEFKITPKPVTLDWFRPAYDEYGDETGEPPVKVDVDHGEKLKLVFNGKAQAPVAEVREGMLVENEDSGEMDVCKVTVSGSRDAVEASESPYKATDIKFSNPDYTRDQNGADYYIIARPVKLAWDKTATTYNGKEQKRTVKITNIQKTQRGKDYSADEGIGVVKVSKITYTPGFHFGTEGKDTDESESTFDGETGYPTETGEPELGMAEGTAIAGNRTPIDAGTYVMTAAELSDPFNYTLVKIDPESIELDPAVIPEVEEPAYVAYHHPIYRIHQYEIKKIDWRNTTVTYNASNQKPIAEVNKSNLQGPDTNKEVAVMIHDDKNSTKDNFAGKCNAKTYTINVLKNDTLRGIKGARCMNYFIGKSAKEMQTKFVINKRLLTVTVLNKTGHYGDNPATYKHTVKYAGLINGKVNTDDNHQNKNIPGKYTNDEGVTKDVVEGDLKYTTNYKKWGKPGKYNIKARGLKSDNYKIKYVAGKLTIKDRKLAGDLVAKANAGNKKAKISWNKVHGAAKYQIYFSLCNEGDKKHEPKLYKTVSASTSSFTIKKLRKNTYYKFYVVALDKSGKRIARTPQHHFCTNNVCDMYTNPKSVNPSKTKVTLNKGKTYKLSATVTKVKAGKKLTNGNHTHKLRYKSANKKVATVSANGTIKAVGSGWCRIYVMAANGIWKVVEVTVK